MLVPHKISNSKQLFGNNLLKSKRLEKEKLKKRRSISKERYVKVTLVADQTMIERYKSEDLENYLLTIMNMVYLKLDMPKYYSF